MVQVGSCINRKGDALCIASIGRRVREGGRVDKSIECAWVERGKGGQDTECAWAKRGRERQEGDSECAWAYRGRVGQEGRWGEMCME